jgi:hypothetical protein
LVPPSEKVLPSQVIIGGTSVMVCAPEYSCVMAKAMLKVPSVTMNGGSLMRVTSSPFQAEQPPSRDAAQDGQRRRQPGRRRTLVMTMLPSAMTMPQDRSMPAVRMISVWPMAMTPTTITCCRISEKFSPVKKRSVVVPKIAQATDQRDEGAELADGRKFHVVNPCEVAKSSGRRGSGLAGPLAPPPGGSGAAATGGRHLPQHSSVPVLTSLLSTPATGLAAIR